MIVIPALGIIIQQVAQAAAIGGLIGGLVGGGAGAVSSIREQGEINLEVAVNFIQGAEKGATGGALGGAGVAAVGVVLAPTIPIAGILTGVQAPVAVVDDVVVPLAGTLDDVAKSTVGNIDDAAAVAKSAVVVDDAASSFLGRARLKLHAVDDAVRPAINAVDDAVRPALNKVGNSAKSVGGSITSRINWARNTWNARFFNRLPNTSPTERYVYVMDDAANGVQKIGMTTKKPSIRLTQVTKDAKSKLDYVCIIRTDKNSGLEGLLHGKFASQKTPHPTPNYSSTEWFVLSAAQVAAACSH